MQIWLSSLITSHEKLRRKVNYRCQNIGKIVTCAGLNGKQAIDRRGRAPLEGVSWTCSSGCLGRKMRSLPRALIIKLDQIGRILNLNWWIKKGIILSQLIDSNCSRLKDESWTLTAIWIDSDSTTSNDKCSLDAFQYIVFDPYNSITSSPRTCSPLAVWDCRSPSQPIVQADSFYSL